MPIAWKSDAVTAYKIDANGNKTKVYNPNQVADIPTFIVTHSYNSNGAEGFDNNDEIRGAVQFIFESLTEMDTIIGFNIDLNKILIDQSALDIYYVDGTDRYKITSNGNRSYTLSHAIQPQVSQRSLTQVDYQPIAIIEDVPKQSNINKAEVSLI